MKASSSVGFGRRADFTRLLERLGRIDRDAFAAVDQGDAVAVLGLVHEVGGDHHGDAALDQRVDDAPRIRAGSADRRPRSARRGTGRGGSCMTAQASARRCLKPSGKPPALSFRCACEVESLGHPRDRVPPAHAGQAIDPGEEVEVLGNAQVAVERELLRHVAEPGARCRAAL